MEFLEEQQLEASEHISQTQEDNALLKVPCSCVLRRAVFDVLG